MHCLTIVSSADGVRVDRHWAAGASLLFRIWSPDRTVELSCCSMLEALSHVIAAGCNDP